MLWSIKENKILIPVSFSLAVLIALSGNYIIAGIGVLLFILSGFIFRKIFFLCIAIVSLLTLVSDIGVEIRTYVQIISFAIIFFLFFKDFAFDFENYPRLPKILLKYLALFFSSMIISIIFSEHISAGIGYLLRTVFFFLIVYAIYAFIQKKEDIVYLLTSLVIVCLVISISVFYDFVKDGFWFIDLSAHTYVRLSGLISNVNATGGYFAVSVPLVIGLLFYSELEKKYKRLLWLALIILLAGLLLTTSRSAFVSVFISAAVIILVIRKQVVKWLLVLTGILLFLFIFIAPLGDIISLLLRLDEGVASRDMFWNLAFNIIKDHPLFGIGPGAYKYEMYHYLPVMLDSWEGTMLTRIDMVTGGSNASHNFFLIFFSDMGIPGLLSAVLLPVLFYSVGAPLLKLFKGKNEFNYIISLTVIAVGSGLFVRAFFEGLGLINYGYITTDLPFWICFAILIFFYQKNIHLIRKKK